MSMQASDKHSFGVKSAILLAAGRGSRLAPYTDHRPKPLLPWRGRATLDLIIDALLTAGVSRLLVVTHYLEEQIRAHLNARDASDGVLIETVSQRELCGTADAVCTAVRARPQWFESSFIVTATDYLVPETFYTELLRFHHAHDCAMSISLKQLPACSQSMRSSVRITQRMQITEVVEKPAPGTEPSEYTANLVYILPPSITPLLQRVTPSARGERELQTAVNQWLAGEGQARGLLQATPLEWQPEMASG